MTVRGSRRSRIAGAIGIGPGPGQGARGLAARAGWRGLLNLEAFSLRARLGAARRMVIAGDAERERIERDLHDGAQQRLTALRIRMDIAAADFARQGDDDASRRLEEFGEEVERAIDELRAFAHGVYPALLTSGGLAPALVAATRLSPKSIEVQADGLRRYPTEIETAVYCSALAAMDNAAKHAGPYATVSIRVWDTGSALRFVVRDDGRGFDPAAKRDGSGIAHMRDRIAAVGGTLTVSSAAGAGTRVEALVPCR